MLMLRTIGRRLPTLIAAALFMLCLAWSGAAEAQTVYTVTNATDDGTGNAPMSGTSLSYAIAQANANTTSGGPITIVFAPGISTVTLTGSMIALQANNGFSITVVGGGVTIDGQNQFQVFAVNDSTSVVGFSNLTINRGLAQGGVGGNGAGGGGGGLGGGGGIYVSQTNTAGISIANVNFTNNKAQGGAGGNADGTTNGGAGGNFNQNASASSTEGVNGGGAQTGGGAGGVPMVVTTNGDGNGADSGYSGGAGGNSNAAANPTVRAQGNGGGDGGVNGQGGDGGNGLGGALFVGNGSTVLIQGGTNFAASNTAVGGAAGSPAGSPATAAGPGLGGSIYLGTEAPFLSGNLATAIFDTSTTDIFVRGDIYSNGNVVLNSGGNAVVNFLGNSTFMATGTSTTINGGTLNGTTNTIVGTIVNNSIIRFTQNGVGTFNSQIVGSGRVDIEGGSFVLFNETNTLGGPTNTYGYTGATNVNNGTLFLGTTLTSSSVNVTANGTFVGDGTVGGSVTNSGLISAGDGVGTMTINGNFTSNTGSVTLVQINSGAVSPGVNSDLLAVNTGNVNLQGGTVFAQLSGGVFSVGQRYPFLTYATRSGPGFTSATTNSAFLGADIDYSVPNQVALVLTRNATTYSSIAQTYNQAQVAGYLDANSAGATGDFATVLDNINALSAAGARNAFDQLGGPIFGTAGRMGIQQTTFMYLMIRRGSRGNEEIGFEELHADGRIAGEAGAGDESIQLVNDNAELNDNSIVPVIRIRRDRRHTWNAWSTSYGTLSTGIGTGLNSLDGRFGSFGTITSVYRYLDDGLKFGVFGAYNHLNLRLIQPYQSSNSDDYQLGSYLRGDDGTSYFLAASSFGWDSYQTARTIQFAQISRQAFGNSNGYQSTGYLEIGRKQQMWPFDLEPFAALQYTYLRQNGFTENNANSINLAVPGIDSNSFRSLIGTRAALDLVTLAGEPLKLELMAAWMHELLDANTTIRSTFAGVGGASFGTEGVNFGRDWLVAGAGLNWAPTENTALAANYDALLNDITNFHLFSASFQLKW